MPVRGQLALAPPFSVEEAVKKLGRQLRTARLRRNMSISEMSEKVGVDRHIIAKAESGKLTTGIGVYAGMLWAMNLVNQLEDVADPRKDDVGMAMARLDERDHAYPSRSLGNDF